MLAQLNKNLKPTRQHKVMGRVKKGLGFTIQISLRDCPNSAELPALFQKKVNRLLDLEKKCVRILIEYLLDFKFKNPTDFNYFLKNNIIFEFNPQLDSRQYNVWLKDSQGNKSLFLFSAECSVLQDTSSILDLGSYQYQLTPNFSFHEKNFIS